MQQFFILTPCLNAAHYIDDTVMSVVAQVGEFPIRYHVQDGGSTDDTLERLEAWSLRLNRGDWPKLCSEVEFTYSSMPDNGLYDAINQGFNKAGNNLSGECMMTWVNAGDRLEQGALQTVTAIRSMFSGAPWITGGLAQINDKGSPITVVPTTLAVSQKAVAAGIHDGRRLVFLQQEGTFWSFSLWCAAGGRIDPALKLAGDFDLWRHMAAHVPCLRVATVTGYFRRHEGGLTADINDYFAEIDALMGESDVALRDSVYAEIQGLIAQKDQTAMIKAGFCGPVVVWNAEISSWEGRTALSA